MIIFDIKFDDDNHDMHLDGSDIAFTNENNVLVQRLRIRLQFLFAEWFLNNQVGVPYIQFIFEQGSSIEVIYSIFRKEIKDTEGVDDIVSLKLTPDPNNKGLRVDFSVNKGTVTDTVEVTI